MTATIFIREWGWAAVVFWDYNWSPGVPGVTPGTPGPHDRPAALRAGGQKRNQTIISKNSQKNQKNNQNHQKTIKNHQINIENTHLGVFVNYLMVLDCFLMVFDCFLIFLWIFEMIV